MGLADDLTKEVTNIFKEQWSTRDGREVPTPDSLKLTNDAILLDATVLYADIDGSTSMVDSFKPTFAAEVYKAYLACVGRIIRDQGGVITAYDGDRIMAVFIGDSKNTTAARVGLKINYIVQKIINPAIKSEYPSTNFSLKQIVGIDTSNLFIVRTGLRGANDLVWVGRAANYAAKLSSLSSNFSTNITVDVYNLLANNSKYSSDGLDMWKPHKWSEMNNATIYGSTYWWPV